jgi:hypothetical protein
MLHIEYPHAYSKRITYPAFQTISTYIYEYYNFVKPWRPIFDPSLYPLDIWNEIMKYLNCRDVNSTRNACKFYKTLKRKTVLSDLPVKLLRFFLTFMDITSLSKMKKTCKKMFEITTLPKKIEYIPIPHNFYQNFWDRPLYWGRGVLRWSNC